MVCNIFSHLRNQFFLDIHQLLRGIVLGRCRELTLKVLRVVLVVDEADVHRHLQLNLLAVAIAAYAFVVLVEARDLTRENQIATLLHLTQLRLLGIDIGQAVIEDSLHGRPNVRRTNGLRSRIINAGTIELVANGTGHQHHCTRKDAKELLTPRPIHTL